MTRYYYACSKCEATYTSPHPLERCQAIRRGVPCRAELVKKAK